MATAVQRQHLEKRFNLWDKDGDGQITIADLEAETARLVSALGEPENSPKVGAVSQAAHAMWDLGASKAGQAAGAVGGLVGGLAGAATSAIPLPKDTFITLADTLIIAAGEAGYNTVLRPTISAIASLLDRDGDGQVTGPDFKVWLSAIGVDQPSQDAAFSKLDSDGDGKISVQQIVDAVRDYHFGNLDAPMLGA